MDDFARECQLSQHGKLVSTDAHEEGCRTAELKARAAMLGSLARSQQALARILDSVADISEHSPHAARLLREQAGSLTAYQESIAETVTGLAWRRRVRKRGRAGEPWLQPGLRLGRRASFEEAGGERHDQEQG
jgi:hypothetical protein